MQRGATPVTCLAALAQTWQGSQCTSTMPRRPAALKKTHQEINFICSACFQIPSGARASARYWEVSVSMPMRERNKRFRKLSMNARVSSYGCPFRRCKSFIMPRSIQETLMSPRGLGTNGSTLGQGYIFCLCMIKPDTAGMH